MACGAVHDAREVPEALRGEKVIGRAVRWDDAAIGQQFTGVVKEQDAVAEQAPTLLRMTRDHTRGLTIGRYRVWARGLVVAHLAPLAGLASSACTTDGRYPGEIHRMSGVRTANNTRKTREWVPAATRLLLGD